MQLFIDLHCHSRFSADGVAEPEALVREAKEKGLHGFAITDHNTCACVDYFLQHGFMNKEGLPVNGLLIIPGQEITTAEGHLLALGVTLPDLKGIPAIEAVALIHKAGGLAIPPLLLVPFLFLSWCAFFPIPAFCSRSGAVPNIRIPPTEREGKEREG